MKAAGDDVKIVTGLGASRFHEYAIEAVGLGLFMISASAFGILIEHPNSPVRLAVANPLYRRALMGIAMGLTAATLTYSRWGKRSGAHFNPAFTLTFFRLGKVATRDLVGYVVAQFFGGAAGMLIASVIFGNALSHAAVHYVVTHPGPSLAGAFLAEMAITGLLMTVVLHVSNTARIARFTGWCAAACVALFITFEAPISGMSLNPARSLASALAAQDWTALWIYFLAPPLGMMFAAAIYRGRKNPRPIACAKLIHPANVRCIFCEYHQRGGR